MLPVVYSPGDIPTVRNWAAAVYVSEPVLYGRCAANSVSAKNSLDLARLLRISVLPLRYRAHVLNLFGNRDIRSVNSLLKRSGISPAALSSASPPLILDAQRCVTNSGVLDALRREINRRQ